VNVILSDASVFSSLGLVRALQRNDVRQRAVVLRAGARPPEACAPD